MYGITASAGFGPLTVKGMFYMAQNFAEYAAGTAYNYAAFWDGTKICDEEFTAYGVNLAYKVSDTLALSASYVAGESELDRPGTYEDETSHYHVNATFTMAKGVTITPEFLVLDRGDVINAGVKTEQAVDTRYGVYWKIAF